MSIHMTQQTQESTGDARVAFIGLGRMGAAMARNLQAAGNRLCVYNRTEAAAGVLRDAGAEVAQCPCDAVYAGGIAISMVRDDAALEAVAFGDAGFAPALGAGGLHIAMGTLSPAMAAQLATRHAALGSAFICAPVQGPPAAAQSAQLVVWLAGAAVAKQRALPLFERMARRVIDLGNDPAHAAVAKLLVNYLMFSSMTVFAEALTLAQAHGLDPAQLGSGLTATVFDAPFFKGFVPLLLQDAPGPASNGLAIAVKDMALLHRQAGIAGLSLPVAEQVLRHFQAAEAQGRESFAAAAVAASMRQSAGLESAAAHTSSGKQ
jgi:3-hydroxyisobutyrate dehydrogenase-like beta-hydroxyacid dehydrogenase